MFPLALAAGAGYLLVEWVSRGALTRALLTVAIVAFATAEELAARAVRLVRPPRFVVTGSCHRCGDCCRMIVADPPRLVKDTALLRLLVLYHRALRNFTVTGRGPNDEVIFSCGHLRADGRCGIYARRPLLCRNYPLRPFFTAPQLMPECSYQIAPQAVARMHARASLPIVNPGVTVHHPTRTTRGALGQSEDYEWLDDTPGG